MLERRLIIWANDRTQKTPPAMDSSKAFNTSVTLNVMVLTAITSRFYREILVRVRTHVCLDDAEQKVSTCSMYTKERRIQFADVLPDGFRVREEVGVPVRAIAVVCCGRPPPARSHGISASFHASEVMQQLTWRRHCNRIGRRANTDRKRC